MKLGINKKLRTDIRGSRARLDAWGEDLYADNNAWRKQLGTHHLWHDWYAWHPVYAYDATTDRLQLVWRETVRRRRIPAIAGTGVSGVDTGYWVHKIDGAT